MIEVSLLKFADDTLFIEDASVRNIFVIKSILRCFELMVSLKVNFGKNKIEGVGVEIRSLCSFASSLNCKRMQLPFTCPVIAKVEKRLSKWKRKTLSFGGRLRLIKYVLSSVPLYYLSFFKMSPGIAARCNNNFKMLVILFKFHNSQH